MNLTSNFAWEIMSILQRFTYQMIVYGWSIGIIFVLLGGNGEVWVPASQVVCQLLWRGLHSRAYIPALCRWRFVHQDMGPCHVIHMHVPHSPIRKQIAASCNTPPSMLPCGNVPNVRNVHDGYMVQHQTWHHVPEMYIFPEDHIPIMYIFHTWNVI